MSNDTGKKPRTWEYIGYVSTTLIIIWTATQLYNNFYKPTDFDSEITANYYSYQTTPDYINLEKDYNIFKTAVKVITQSKEPIKVDIDSILPTAKKIKGIQEESRLFSKNLPNYKRFWIFKIKNTGNKVLDSLTLDIPLEGAFQYVKQNESPKEGNFKNKVFIGNLKPSYSATINCWVEDNYQLFEDDEKNYKFSHNNGVFEINLPIKKRHFWSDPTFYLWILGGLFIFFLGVYISHKPKIPEDTTQDDEANTSENPS